MKKLRYKLTLSLMTIAQLSLGLSPGCSGSGTTSTSSTVLPSAADVYHLVYDQPAPQRQRLFDTVGSLTIEEYAGLLSADPSFRITVPGGPIVNPSADVAAQRQFYLALAAKYQTVAALWKAQSFNPASLTYTQYLASLRSHTGAQALSLLESQGNCPWGSNTASISPSDVANFANQLANRADATNGAWMVLFIGQRQNQLVVRGRNGNGEVYTYRAGPEAEEGHANTLEVYHPMQPSDPTRPLTSEPDPSTGTLDTYNVVTQNPGTVNAQADLQHVETSDPGLARSDAVEPTRYFARLGYTILHPQLPNVGGGCG